MENSSKSVPPLFKLELNHKILSSLVTIGNYDGLHPCLTAVTNIDKIIIHTPHAGGRKGDESIGRTRWSEDHREIAILNMSQTITALASGPLKPAEVRDILLVGSPSQILAYDVHDNTDLFYKETPDGVNVIAIGILGAKHDSVVVIGGNSSVLILDYQGNELFWTVIDGKVRSLLLFDYDKDGDNELVVGSEDFMIRIYKNEQILTQLTETGNVIGFASLACGRFAYCLSNGTIGVYEEGIRLWRIKSKHCPVALYGCNADTLAVLWSGGRLEWRIANAVNDAGHVLKRAVLDGGGAALLASTLRNKDQVDLVAVSTDGQVVGFPVLPEENPSLLFLRNQKSGAVDWDQVREEIKELLDRKKAIQNELRHYESNAAASASGAPPELTEGALPANTRLQVSLTATKHQAGGYVEVAVSCDKGAIVRGAMLLAEGLFPEGSEMIAHIDPVNEPKNEIVLKITPPCDIQRDIHVKAFVGYQTSEQFHLFEMTRQLPRFSMYFLLSGDDLYPDNDMGSVTFSVTERLQRLCMWLNQNFILPDEVSAETEDTQGQVQMNLLSLRDGKPLEIVMKSDGLVTFRTPNIQLAADLVQSLASFLNLEHLQSAAQFPLAEAKALQWREAGGQLSEARSRAAAGAAEASTILAAKAAATYATLNALPASKVNQMFAELIAMNTDLLTSNLARKNNYDEAAKALQSLHGILQHAARLRVGKYSRTMLASVRKAVAADNVDALIRIMRVGSD